MKKHSYKPFMRAESIISRPKEMTADFDSLGQELTKFLVLISTLRKA
jgi:hypothetical protein